MGVCVPNGMPGAELRAVLAEGGHTVPIWLTAQDAAAKACQAENPDLFLLMTGRPDSASLRCVNTVVEACESTKVIMICERTGEGGVRAALDAGARAVMASDEIQSALLPVIEAVQAGQVCVPLVRSNELGRNVLTRREREVLGEVVRGMTNAQIATNLFLAESTVKSHLSSAFAKLGVTSRSEAAAVILDPASGVGQEILAIHSEGRADGARVVLD